MDKQANNQQPVAATDVIFPPTTFTEGELIELKEAFSNPIVVKYLRSLSRASTIELLTLPSSLSDRDIAIAHSNVAGQLAAFSTLLSI